MSRLLVLITTCLLTAISTARATFIERYNAAYLDMRSGMPSNYVEALLQDSYGFVWICNYGGGLLRYDGYTYQQPMLNSATTAMSSSCRNACEDQYKRLWVAFDDGTQVIDLCTLHPASLTYRGKSIDNILREPAVKTMHDSDGNIWLATRAHIYYIRCKADGSIAEILQCNHNSNVPDIVMKDIFRDGSIITSIDQNLYQLRPHNGKLIRTRALIELGDMSTHFITDIAHHNHRTWVATNNGLYSIDDATRNVKHYYPPMLSHTLITCLTPLDGNLLLLGSLHGVNILNTRDDSISLWSTADTTNPLSSDYVSCIMLMDKQIWVGTETGGIVKLTPRELSLQSFTHNSSSGSLSAGNVNAIYAEPSGTVWVGTVDGGLNRLAAGSSTFTHFTTANSQLPHNSVSTLTADNRQQLWIGTWGGGICTVGLSQPSSISRLNVGGAMQQRIAYIGALAYDKYNDGMWIGANEGLYFYDLRQQRLIEPFSGCRDIRGCIGSIVERNGTLWVGCIDGVVSINLKKPRRGKGGTLTFVHTQHNYRLDMPQSRVIEQIACFLQTHDGTLWLGSNKYGLYKRVVDSQGKTSYKVYSMRDGLSNNSVKGLVEDSRGMIWITTNNGLSRLNPRTGTFTNYTNDDGLLTNQFYWNSAVNAGNGIIYLGTTRGLMALNLSQKPSNRPAGHLRFTRLDIDNQEISADGKHLTIDVSTADRIKLHEWNKSLEISFSALNYDHEKSSIYSYRLKGFDREWQQLPAGQHTLRYTNLPSGNYTLEVRYTADNIDGSTSIASIDIKVVPYFYKRLWFISLVIVAIVAIAVYVYKRHIRELRQQEADNFLDPIRRTLTETTEPEQLRRRIQTIVDNQLLYHQSYIKTAHDNDDQMLQKTEPFMEKVMRIMEQNYMNSEFGVSELSDQMGMTKAQLAKKLNMETGQSTTKFICCYRLNIAHELLLKNAANRNIAEIAFSVGFNDPKYFTRCFTREYGVSPSKLS